MFDRITKAVESLERQLQDLDPDTIHPKDAPGLLKLFSKVEKLGAAGKSLVAARVASGGSWRKHADPTPAHFISRVTGDSVGACINSIETARRMAELPTLDRAYRCGALTQAQAHQIASAASVAPDTQHQLLRVAETQGIAALKTEAQRVIAQACKDQAGKAQRLHNSRYLRSWTDSEGAFRLDARLTPEAGAEVRVALDTLRDDLFHQARKQGIKDSYQALDADALVAMARASHSGDTTATGPRALVNVRVDHSALVRGHTTTGEVCEIAGVGPIPVAAARALASDCILKVLVTKASEIKAVAHYGRTIPSKLKTAVTETYPECAVAGCHQTKYLEIDHVIPLAEGGPTSMANLSRLCSAHHRLKTYKNYRLVRDDGQSASDSHPKWRLVPPPERTRAGPSS